MDLRQQQLQTWLESILEKPVSLTPVVGDASFRRYFRVTHNNEHFIAMDSPPDKEDCKPFVAIAKRLLKLNLNAPEILYADEENGFLLISDLGNELYHRELNDNNADQLYRNALRDLLIIHNDYQGEKENLPLFGWEMMQTELNNFTTWFLEKYLHLDLDLEDKITLEKTYAFLVESATEQPQTFVHRDYHSRNLMIMPNQQVGILDFQDAVVGPITYDLVSLIRDCYADWPLAQVEAWALDFYQDLLKLNLIPHVDQKTYLRWFDLMGMQRHLKAIFIFARKFLRDGNDLYLQFIPRALNYVKHVCGKYEELKDFQEFFESTILPAWKNKVDGNPES